MCRSCGLCFPLVLVVIALLGSPSPSLAQPSDGTYSGSTDQGRPISVTVAGGQITGWTVEYACPGFTSTSGTTTTCSIASGVQTFSCGTTFCAPFVSSSRVSGAFSGSSVSGLLSVKHQPSTTSSCCTLTDRTWSASCPDSDIDAVCDSADRCPGFDDSVDTDGDGKPDGCDACPAPGGDCVFDDGFESGDTARWSGAL